MITIEEITRQIQIKNKAFDTNRHAAVLLPIINIKDKLHLLFQVRSLQLQWQPGDICFPGGRIESFDLTAEDAAKRETCEELGLTLNDIAILGHLPKVVATFGFNIYPFIGHLESLDKVTINTNEVEKIFTVPIEWFINNPPHKATMEVAYKPANDFPFDLFPERSKAWQKRSEYPLYFYHYKNYVIWGLTAQIVNLFLEKINGDK